MSKGPYSSLKSLPGLVTPKKPSQTLLATLRGLLSTSTAPKPPRKSQGDTVFDSQALLFVGICIGVAIWVYVSISESR